MSPIGFGPFMEYLILEMLILLSVDIIFCYSVIYFLRIKLTSKFVFIKCGSSCSTKFSIPIIATLHTYYMSV